MRKIKLLALLLALAPVFAFTAYAQLVPGGGGGGSGPTTYVQTNLGSVTAIPVTPTAVWTQSVTGGLPAGKCLSGEYRLESVGGAIAPSALTISMDAGVTGANAITNVTIAVVQNMVWGHFEVCNRTGTQSTQETGHGIKVTAESPAYARGSEAARTTTTTNLSSTFTLGLYVTSSAAGVGWQIRPSMVLVTVWP